MEIQEFLDRKITNIVIGCSIWDHKVKITYSPSNGEFLFLQGEKKYVFYNKKSISVFVTKWIEFDGKIKIEIELNRDEKTDDNGILGEYYDLSQTNTKNLKEFITEYIELLEGMRYM